MLQRKTDMSVPLQTRSPEPLIVYFDGGCPICTAEIGTYQRLSPLKPVRWDNVADPAMAMPADATREALLARFHVRLPDGRLVSGGRAFLHLWSALPGWRYAGALKAVPGVPLMADFAYAVFLRARPVLQAIARRLRWGAKPA
jgi:predicted DCC family thiol-disulfide oxidoreductase YuxK